MPAIHGVLLDIDGVLHVSMQPIRGATETLRWLEQHGYQTCFVTNTTTSSRATLVQKLHAIGLPLPEERVMTAPVATANYIRQHYAGKRCWLLTKGNTAGDFAGIELVDDQFVYLFTPRTAHPYVSPKISPLRRKTSGGSPVWRSRVLRRGRAYIHRGCLCSSWLRRSVRIQPV